MSIFAPAATRHRLQLISLLSAVALIASCRKAEPAASAANAPANASTVEIETDDQRVSYGIGFSFGQDIGRQPGLTVDAAALQAGLQDALTKAQQRVSEADLQAAFTAVRERAASAAAKEGETNLATAQTYLEENRKRPGVTVTASGLQYEVLKSGNGPKPKATDTVEVHYHGTLVDGTVFDSSVQRGETIQFPVNGVIPGWVEALQLMSVGDKWKLTIPPALGYGARAAGKIPPQSALIFEVELIGIK
ncbi:MAG TPA: FKBP-type peptidyl-prolyl cis-trans isomerase [Candidatus Synoicihabitans sp.]|nr:FKBP-type peptidyl-prolyl cis-trans isomerase [Candidatus Synoicihabitans sp.]